jgi:thiamine biosynthesis lipoprotein
MKPEGTHGLALSRRAVLAAWVVPAVAHALPPRRTPRVELEAPARGPSPVHRSGTFMGQPGELWAWADSAAALAALESAADAALAELERVFALTSSADADSDIARINGAAGGLPVQVSPETYALIRRCLELSEFSGGVFDITYAAMRRLWTFDGLGASELPAREEVERLRKAVDYRKVVLDDARGSVLLPGAQMRVGLGGVARGYAVDKALRALTGAGARGAFLRVGRLHSAAGEVPQPQSRVAVPDPRQPTRVLATVPLRNGAVGMAVDHDRFFIHKGRRYHALIDPRTGYPARASRTAVVMAPTAMDAEWMSTAAFILGAKESGAMLKHVRGAEALWVTSDNVLEMTDGMRRRVTVLGSPTPGNP